MTAAASPPPNDRPGFALRSYGCQMNDLDSEYIDGLLRAAGWRRVERFEDADAIIVNTCAVRAGAEARALGRVASCKPLKERLDAPRPLVALTGCVAQKEGAELLDRFPHVDLVVGTRDWPRLVELLERANAGERLVAVDGIDRPLERSNAVERRSRVKAFVEIMVGCDNFCAYCIVPHTRGREVSRPINEVLDDLRRLADEGFREITLIGQNVNSYRDGPRRLPDLLARANDIDGLARLRFLTSNPHDLSDDLVDAMASLDKVCEALHFPAQSGSDAVLARMNRKYTRADYLDRVERLRAAMPDVALSTDLLVGFPGETDSQFQETLSLMDTVRWSEAFTFMYSVREGTDAARLPDDVSPEVKQRRVAALIERQERIAGEINAALIGRHVEVLVEAPSRRSGTDLLGRTRQDRPVVFAGDAALIGRLVDVEILASSPHTLRGRLPPV